VYGFRSIQNLVRRMKRGQCAYDFVEVMACPGGCLNGGGQISVQGGQADIQKHLERLDETYHNRADVQVRDMWLHLSCLLDDYQSNA
jgi:iron only hydrogenase large subunit-like protein